MCDRRSRSRSRDRGGIELSMSVAVSASALVDSSVLDSIDFHVVGAPFEEGGVRNTARALLSDAARAVRAGHAERGVAFAGAARRCCWDALHAGDWRSAPDWARTFYALAAALECALLLAAARAEVAAEKTGAMVRDARRGLDVALLLCPPHSAAAAFSPRALVHSILAAAPLPLNERQSPPLPSLPRAVATRLAIAAEEWSARNRRSVSRLESPTLRSFLEAASQGPVVVTGTIEHWPALTSAARCWENLARLESVLRGRVAPVEVGAHYLAVEWRETLVPLDDFVANVIAPSVRDTLRHAATAAPLGPALVAGAEAGGVSPPPTTQYLAQVSLFDQVPALQDDISVPDLVAAFDHADGPGEGVRTLAWLGPAGTFTPLHFDAPRNFLAQVVGVKRIRLHSPDETPSLGPLSLSNTVRLPAVALAADLPVEAAQREAAQRALAAWSASNDGVDDENAPDDTWPARFPEYAGLAPPLEAILRPGDVIFIPPKWWHSVTALTASFSVSHWF